MRNFFEGWNHCLYRLGPPLGRQPTLAPKEGHAKTSTEGKPIHVSDRDPIWISAAEGHTDPVVSATIVLRKIIDGDPLGRGQVEDLEYVTRAIERFPGVEKKSKSLSFMQALSSTDLDENVVSFLSGFTQRKENPEIRKTFRQVAKAVMFGVRLQKMVKTANTRDLCDDSEGLSPELGAGIQTWSFDIFLASKSADRSPLVEIAGLAMQQQRVMRELNIKQSLFRNFCMEIENQYLENPYHNSLHAADVVQTTHRLLTNTTLRECSSELEVLSAIFAAVCHDVGHPGVTNEFRVKKGDEDAITYNDISVNENMHCAIAFRTLYADSCNFMKTMIRPQVLSVRKMAIGIILGTDMAFHFDKLSQVKATIEERGPDVTKWQVPMRGLEFLVHCADISNVAKPVKIALQWTDRVLQEFFEQGDRERELGLDVSPLCDRHTVSKAGSQCGFIGFIVKPSIECISAFCEVAEKEAKPCLDEYHDYWSAVHADEKAAKGEVEKQDK